MIVWVHLLTALAILVLGGINLAAAKGTLQHKVIGWVWTLLMLAAALSSFGIRELRGGAFSWIHLLTVLTLISMAWALIAIRLGRVRTHARAMTGTMIGAAVAGGFALAPGRFISHLFGYG